MIIRNGWCILRFNICGYNFIFCDVIISSNYLCYLVNCLVWYWFNVIFYYCFRLYWCMVVLFFRMCINIDRIILFYLCIN